MSGHRGGAFAQEGGTAARPAVRDDTAEVVRLAGMMYESMGQDVSGVAWRRVAGQALERRLGDDVAVFVVDDPATPGRLAACGAASVSTRLPGPTNPDARVGYIQWISTDPGWRRRGLARVVTLELLSWLRASGVGSVELHATPHGEPLYRALGFDGGANPGLRLRIPS